MSAVETIRDIPVIVQHMKGCSEPMDFDDDEYYYDSGFPFDNTGRRSRDPLEDIAQRHPEFAQHLQGFPRRSQRSTPDNQNNDEFLRRRFERPFASGRFERFGFPFDRDDFEREPQRYYEAYPEYFESFQNQQPQQNQSSSPQGYQQHPPQYSQQYQPQQENQPHQYQNQQSVSQGTQTEDDNQSEVPAEQQEEEQKTDSGQTTRGRPIQQSNTCDLTQHQPPDESLNDREPRSMSAPPENKTRFTSSVNIPMGVHSPEGARSQASSGSTERVIPIHVEGRDDPVIPKNASAQTHSGHQPQAERIFTTNTESPRPQAETIFGRRPEAFTQFVHREPHRFNNDWQHSFGGFPEEDFRFRSESPSRFAAGGKPQQQPPRQESYQQQQAPRQEAKPQQQEQPPKQQQPPAEPPKQQQQPLGPIEQIQAIQKDVSTLLRQVEAFNGQPRDKNYLYLDEMLTRNLLKLDNVDTQGQDTIRSARKEAIKCIERAISLLETRAAANVVPKQEENMEVEEQKPQENEKIEEVVAEASQEAGEKSAEPEQPKSDETMENVEGEAKKEEIIEEPKPEEEAPKEEDTKTEPEEKKEKKKIKKKVNKEDKKQ